MRLKHLVITTLIACAGLTGCGGGSKMVTPTAIVQPAGPPPILEANSDREEEYTSQYEAWQEEMRLQEELRAARVFSKKPGEWVGFYAPEVLGSEHEGSTLWNLQVVSRSAELAAIQTGTKKDWSQTQAWGYQVPLELADGRYGVDFSATNQTTGRPLTFSIEIDVKKDGHPLPFQVYPANGKLACSSGRARIWLDGFWETGYETGQITVYNPNTSMPTTAFWTEEDQIGTEVEVSTYWLGDNQLEEVGISVKYLDSNKQVQTLKTTFEVAESCHYARDYYQRTATSSEEGPLAGVQRPINR